MKKINLFSIIILLIIISQNSFCQTSDAVLGTWFNQEKEAKIEIFKVGIKYYGKIVWLKIPNDENGKTKLDIHNSDNKLKPRKILGLQMMQDFEYIKGNLWENGKIYDPKNGKTYSCKMTLVEKNKLEVRGFVGFSIIGRTNTWTRAN